VRKGMPTEWARPHTSIVQSPNAVVVDKEGTIVVVDRENNRLRRIVGLQVVILAGGSERA
jgi:hypothetical protein